MQRRSFLRWSGALSLSAGLNASIISKAVAAMAVAGKSRVRPGDVNWPSEAVWSELKQAVHGNLLAVPALFGACVAQPEGEACSDVVSHMHNPFYLGDQPGGTQVSGWLNAWKPAPSVYAIKAQTTADVVAGVNFARQHNLRLVVKGTGHSYQGTSNAPDSLLIWTRAMKQVP